MWLFIIFVTLKTTLQQIIYELLLIKGVCGILVVLLWVFGWDFCCIWGFLGFFFVVFLFGGLSFGVIFCFRVFGLVFLFSLFLFRVVSVLGRDLGSFLLQTAYSCLGVVTIFLMISSLKTRPFLGFLKSGYDAESALVFFTTFDRYVRYRMSHIETGFVQFDGISSLLHGSQ